MIVEAHQVAKPVASMPALATLGEPVLQAAGEVEGGYPGIDLGQPGC
jgi:hypothetical protein